MCFCVFPAFSFPGMQDALHIWTREGLLLPLAYRSSAASFSNFVIVLPSLLELALLMLKNFFLHIKLPLCSFCSFSCLF